MKAVVLHEYGGPDKLVFEDDFPDPLTGGNTVLIAAAAASVNPIDWKLRSGSAQQRFPLSFPAILGRDVSGIVRQVGANVVHFKPGDRVLALTNKTYAELVAVDDSDVTHLPDGVDLVDSAAIPLISLTGDQLVRVATNVQKGQVVLITGALGGVGRAAVHSAKKIGAQVIAGVRAKQLDAARALGVSGVLAIDDDQAIENFPLVDAIADTVGGDTAAKLIAKVKPGGSFGYASMIAGKCCGQKSHGKGYACPGQARSIQGARVCRRRARRQVRSAHRRQDAAEGCRSSPCAGRKGRNREDHPAGAGLRKVTQVDLMQVDVMQVFPAVAIQGEGAAMDDAAS